MTKPSRRIEKECLVCGKKIRVFLHPDNTMRGGHYFGELPLYTDAEFARAKKGGTHKVLLADDWEVDVMNIEPKPYAYKEYWECPKCYWGK